MNKYEKDEISRLDPKYRPIGAWAYFGYQILFSIPLIGFICLIVFACSDSNINRRSFARSYFCALIIGVIFVVIIIAISILGAGSGFLEALREAMQSSGQ